MTPSRDREAGHTAPQRAESTGRSLALDIGEARIGVAVCDPDGIVCTPLHAITRTDVGEDIAKVVAIARREGAERIVAGLPLTMAGRRGTQAQAVLRFCSELRNRSSLPVDTWDERLTTVEAEARLREAGVQPSRDRARLDSAAAALTLEAYLAARKHRDEMRGRRPE